MKKKSILMAVAGLGLVCGGGLRSQASVPPAVAAYQASVMAEPNLISYYEFDASTGTDSKGSHHGTMAGTVGFAAGVGGGPDQALNLTGSGWGNLGVVPAFDYVSGNGTVEMWVRADWNPSGFGNYPVIVANWDTTTPKAYANYAFSMDPTKSYIAFWDTLSSWSGITLPTNAGTNWHHLAIVFNPGSSWTLFWDGVNAGTGSIPARSAYHGGQTLVGSPLPSGGFSTLTPWIGRLDEVAFYSTNLPLAGIQAHRAAYVTNFQAFFPVSAYGAVVNSTNDSGPAIRSAIQAALGYGPGATVTFQAGTYKLSPDGATGYCLNMAYANGLSLQGSNTTLIVTEPLTGGMFWQFCQNCSVSGFTIDYNPLPFTQGTIVAKGASTFNVTLDAGYPQLSESRFSNPALANWGMVMDPTKAQPTQKAGVDDFVPMTSLTLVSGSTYRFTPANSGVISQVAVNDRFVYIARGGGFDLHFWNCANCVVSNVTVNSGPTAAFVATTGTTGMQILNSSISFPTNSGRLLTTDADGIIFQNLRSGSVVANNYFEGMADDGMSVGCTPFPISVVSSTTSITVNGSYSDTPILTGDRVQIFNPATGTIRGETTVTAVTHVSTNYQLTLASPISGMVAGTTLANSDTLYDLSASGEGYLFTNNVINSHRGRGILPYAGNGIVISNTIIAASCSGIEMMNYAGPYYWIGPLPNNVLIYGNTISGCGYADAVTYAAIRVNAYISGYYVAASGICMSNITIQNNTITNWPQIGISAASVSNLKLLNNQIQSSSGANSYGGNIQGMVLGNSTGIMVNGGSITDPRSNLKAGIRVLNTVAKGTPGFSTNNLTFNLVAGRTKILDDRTAGPANATPSIPAIPTQTVMVGSNFSLTITATDATVTPLYFSLVSGPAGAGFTDPLQLDGVFTWSPTAAQVGTNTVVVKVQDNGSPNQSATQTFQIVVPQPGSTTALVSSANPSTYGGAVTLTASVMTTNHIPSNPPTGTVTFLDGVTTLGTGALGSGSGNSATAALTLTNLTAATHSITASYGGDANFAGSVSSAQSQVVNPKPLTVTGVTAGNKVYDGSTNAVLNGTAALAGVVSGDTVTLTGTPAASFADKNVGTGKLVIVSGYTLGGASAANYSLTQPTTTADITPASTAVGLASSLNPAGPGTNVIFTATVIRSGGGTPTNAVQFRTNGVAAALVNLNGSAQATYATSGLPHGSNAVTAEYVGDGNFLASTNSMVQVVNTVPVANALTLDAVSGLPATLQIIGGTNAPTDADGDVLTVTAVSAPANGIASTDGTNATYTATNSFAGTDSFNYTVSDTYGGTATNTVTVNVVAANAGLNRMTAGLSDGNVVLTYLGISGNNYALEQAFSLSPPVWVPVVTNPAPTDGYLMFTNPPQPGNSFWRIRYVP